MATTKSIDRSWANRFSLGLGGVAVGVADILAAHLLGFEFTWRGDDVSLVIGAYLAISFGAVGWLYGLTLESRRRERAVEARLSETRLGLAKMRERLAQTEKMAALGQIAGGIAHEVKNPLAVMRSRIQDVAEDLPPSSTTRSGCDEALRQIDHLASFVDSLMRFVRPIAPRTNALRVTELLERYRWLSAELLDSVDVSLHIEGPPPETLVSADIELVAQVLLELTRNAVKAMNGRGRLTLRAAHEEGHVSVTLSDSGPGVPEEARLLVFEPFHSGSADGQGLGLAVARQIVESMGGTLDLAEPESGSGATFSLTLERHDQTAEATA